MPPFPFSSLYPKCPFYLKCPFYMYIVTTASPELHLYRRGGSVTEPHYRGLYKRAPCSHIHLAYSLCQLRVGILPPYALNPYDRSRNVLQTPQIYTLCSHYPRPITGLQLLIYFLLACYQLAIKTAHYADYMYYVQGPSFKTR